MEKLIYRLSYLFNLTPWDVVEMPPELVETLESIQDSPGTALDIGCGKGAYSIYLAKQGWQVIGIDFATNAIKQAQQAANKVGVKIDFRAGDITQLAEMRFSPMKLVLDIKCSHSLSAEGRMAYIDALWSIMDRDSLLLLEAVHPRHEMGYSFGLTESDIKETYAQRFTLIDSKQDNFSGWYWLQKA